MWLFCYRLMEERRERINNFLSELMKEKLDTEDLIIARDIAEAEAELERREKDKHEKTQAQLKAIADYRASVVNPSVPGRRVETTLLWRLPLASLSKLTDLKKQCANCLPTFLKQTLFYL